jgi:hypothetical protein
VLGEQTVYLDEVGNVCLTLTGLVPHLASVKRSVRLHVEAYSVQVACSNGPYLYRIKGTLCNFGYQLQERPVHLSFRNTRTTQVHQAAARAYSMGFQQNSHGSMYSVWKPHL